MESNVAAATVPPVATAAGAASIIASKTFARELNLNNYFKCSSVSLDLWFIVQSLSDSSVVWWKENDRGCKKGLNTLLSWNADLL